LWLLLVYNEHLNNCIKIAPCVDTGAKRIFPVSCPKRQQNLSLVFSTRCNIYISRLCYYASVRLSVTFVHCGHRVRWIPDIFACLDRRMSLLLSDNASLGSSDGMMTGFLVEERGYRKIGDRSDNNNNNNNNNTTFV